MQKFVLFVDCNPVPSIPIRSIQLAARDAGEAECAADALADFAFATLEQDVTVHIHDVSAAREVKVVHRQAQTSI
jgi:hypothetical protein